ncbi:hypothetical protein B6K86_01945 [Lachnospiraceae bacterium]|nr:hypothetical protein B6K86_01945 [Lachnospiraceae bacterium]
MKVAYYAVFNYDEYDPSEKKYGISILFPDIPAANTCARSEKEGLAMALDVLQLTLIDEDPTSYPQASPLEKISLKEHEKAILIQYDTKQIDSSKFKFF